MNAVERLWRALGAGDWASLAAQFGHRAVIERTGEGPLSAAAYVAAERAAGAPQGVEVHRMTGDGTIVAVEATVVRRGERSRVLAIYDLHDAHIRGGTEAWVREER